MLLDIFGASLPENLLSGKALSKAVKEQLQQEQH